MSNSENVSDSENEFSQEGRMDDLVGVYLAKTALEATAKLYGPIFTRMASKYALEFESEKLNEKPPENIQGLEAVTNYILANLNQYSQGHCALIYGIVKAESKLQGFAGSGARRAAYSAIKSILESTGMLNSVVGTTEDAFEACKKMSDVFKAMKQVISVRFIRGRNNQVTLVFPDCPYKDACSAWMNEGISRMVGGFECVELQVLNASMEIITKKQFDYRLEEFDKPECRGRIFEI